MLGELFQLWRVRRWLKSGGVDTLNTEKLKSRKLWLTILGSAGVTLLAQMGAPEYLVKLVGTIFVTYLGSQAAVDLMKAKNGG